jgi:hypothetical protein
MNIHFSNAQSQSQLQGHNPEEITLSRTKTRTPRCVPTPQQTQNQNQTGHIVGPAVARDVQVLEQFMSPTYGGLAVSYARPNPYIVYSDDPKHPIVYLKVPRQRVAASLGNGSAGFKQYETIEKILEPLGSDLFSLWVFLCASVPSFALVSANTKKSTDILTSSTLHFPSWMKRQWSRRIGTVAFLIVLFVKYTPARSFLGILLRKSN